MLLGMMYDKQALLNKIRNLILFATYNKLLPLQKYEHTPQLIIKFIKH